jgi:hypothetical protein
MVLAGGDPCRNFSCFEWLFVLPLAPQGKGLRMEVRVDKRSRYRHEDWKAVSLLIIVAFTLLVFTS